MRWLEPLEMLPREEPPCALRSRRMIACVDVDYRGDSAVAACLHFSAWGDERPLGQTAVRVDGVQPYEPGRFYQRELPCLLAVLAAVPVAIDLLIVDAYVVLDEHGKPGLGAHVHAALHERVAVVGVAKTRFATATSALPIVRGSSTSPLWVTARGMDQAAAAAAVAQMHGPYRVPTLLAAVDRLARTAFPELPRDR